MDLAVGPARERGCIVLVVLGPADQAPVVLHAMSASGDPRLVQVVTRIGLEATRRIAACPPPAHHCALHPHRRPTEPLASVAASTTDTPRLGQTGSVQALLEGARWTWPAGEMELLAALGKGRETRRRGAEIRLD